MLSQIAKTFWQDFDKNKASLPDKSTIENLVLRKKWSYSVHKVFGSLWFASFPSYENTLTPGGKLYRVSLGTLKWGKYENESSHPMTFGSGSVNIKFSDLENISLEEVPNEVLVLGMLVIFS